MTGYEIKNICIFIYPIYGWLVYSYYKWPKLTPYIAWGLTAFILYTIPYQNYAQKPLLMSKVIEIYHQDKKELRKTTYKPIEIKPSLFKPGHPVCGYTPVENMKSLDIVFRLLVWEDLCNELIRNKSWFGMGFKHPLRSPQIEMLHIAEVEWRKDGYICAHNSYLYIVYRTGILGVILIVWCLFKFFFTFLGFIDSRDTSGMLLCFCASYWLLQACFQVQFESFYRAIPLWCVCGLILRHRFCYRTTGKQTRL